MADKKKDKRKRNLEKGITQRADGTYCFRQRLKGEKPICVYAKTLEEIRAKKKVIEENRGQDVSANSGDITLDELAKEYFRENKKIRDTTKRQYMIVYNGRISPYLGQRKINSLRGRDFKFLFEQLYSLNMKRASIERVKTIASRIMKQALSSEYIESISFVNVGWDSFLSNKEPKVKEKVHALTTEEQREFMRYIKQNQRHSWLVPIATILLGTGMRCGECFALTWNDVDFENNEISIDKTLVYYGVNNGKFGFAINPPKTDAGKRTIPMLPEVREAFLQLKNNPLFPPCKAIVDGYTGFVFGNDKQNLYIPYNLNARIRTIIKLYNEEEAKKAEKENRQPLQIKPFSLHCLRHTFATNYCQHENNYKTIQSIMGHSDISITMNTYADSKKEAERKSFKALEGKMFFD